ncbi:MAG: hypothetical protein H7Z42_15670, partial [Roseiflexaceae bacterium]|nr:hypothetical protein [Roseiflexaceae bacterium]
RQGQSVLVIQPVSQYDPAGRAALAARSVLMADGAFAHSTARVAVYEPAALGAGYTYLVLAAARAAANGLGLAQVVTLLDQLQVEVRALYVTGSRGPIERVRLRQPNGFQLGGQQLWQIDRASGMLGRLAGSWSVIKALTAPESPLSTRQPDCVSFSDGRLLQALNRELGKAGQLGLAASQAGVGLNSTFPSGCVELTWLPEQAHVAGIIAIIERINRPAHVSRGGIRQRGGL